MPRKQVLSAITPNRYYHLEATLKYLHQTQNVTTAIIEQDNVQKRIKFPRMMPELQQGAQYSFEKCFYSKNGWIRVNETEKIKLVEQKANEFLTLEQIFQNREGLNSTYITTIGVIVQIGETEKKMKDEEELNLTMVKIFYKGLLVDFTVWNKEISKQLVGKAVILQGVRVKLLTSSALILVSTVYTKIHQIEGLDDKYDENGDYKSISQVYIDRTIEQHCKDLEINSKSFSIVTLTIEDIMIFDYEGCSKCRKKIEEGNSCKNCGQGVTKGQFWVSHITGRDETGQLIAYVFDEKLLGAFRLAKKGTKITGKMKSTIRTNGEQKMTSNVLTGISSILF